MREGSPVQAPFEQRAIRAETFVQIGELSHARQVLEGADLAPGTKPRWMLSQMRSVANVVPPRVFELDEVKFNRNLCS